MVAYKIEISLTNCIYLLIYILLTKTGVFNHLTAHRVRGFKDSRVVKLSIELSNIESKTRIGFEDPRIRGVK